MILDPESERQRLARLYADMSDGELEKLAETAFELADEAREALRAEFSRRKFNVSTLDNVPGYYQVEQQSLVVVGKFLDLANALPARTMLESAGIQCFLGDDNLIRMDWFISNLLGGVKLLVREEDAEAAQELLSQPVQSSYNVEGFGEYKLPRCPKCQSLDIIFEGLNKPVALISAYAGFPIPLRRNTWKCEACGNEWQDTEGSDAEEDREG